MVSLKKYKLLLLCCFFAATMPAADRVKATWMASVANIDWPRASTIGNSEQQEQDLIHFIDSLAAVGINTIIFQVRPTADALYASTIEPVSHWLTGKQGEWGEAKPWDPLAVAIEQAHLRQISLHAWLNPYRVNIGSIAIEDLDEAHPMRLHPEWFWKYGTQWYFDPAQEVTRTWLCDVVRDIIAHYDVDGIHMDDYFYPYPIKGQSLPDQARFKADPRGFEDIGDWRRDNVNKTIQAVSETIREMSEDIVFGISPFGIYKTNYEQLYADIVLWAKEGWIDYVIPQLYWAIDSTAATDYATLARWWAEALPETCDLYTGHAMYRMGQGRLWDKGDEIVRQNVVNQGIEAIDGECYYSAKFVLQQPNALLTKQNAKIICPCQKKCVTLQAQLWTKEQGQKTKDKNTNNKQ